MVDFMSGLRLDTSRRFLLFPFFRLTLCPTFSLTFSPSNFVIATFSWQILLPVCVLNPNLTRFPLLVRCFFGSLLCTTLVVLLVSFKRVSRRLLAIPSCPYISPSCSKSFSARGQLIVSTAWFQSLAKTSVSGNTMGFQ